MGNAKFSDNAGHNILPICSIKQDWISSMISFVHKLPYQLSNDLRVQKLGNKQILGEPQNCVVTQPSPQSTLTSCFFLQ